MDPSNRLTIRADAGAGIGTGHIIRCLALAQVWKAETGGAVLFVSSDLPISLEKRLQDERFEVARITGKGGSNEDVLQTIKLAQANGAGWLVVDGYRFGSDYQGRIKDAGLPLLFLDDYGHAAPYRADFVLNQNLHATAACYEGKDRTTRLLLGTRYVLLRREFFAHRDCIRSVSGKARRVLVTLGGSDPSNVSAKVMLACQKACIQDLEVIVVVGGSNQHIEKLKAIAVDADGNMKLVFDVHNIAELMAWADVAVTAGGTTSWELAFMQLPSLMIVNADNQIDVARALDAEGLTVSLGWHDNVTVEQITVALRSLLGDDVRRRAMAMRGRNLVDGDGGCRVITHMRTAHMGLRRATPADSRQLFDWANEPAARASAFSSDPIPYDVHLTWLQGKLNSVQCVIYIGMDHQGNPVGQVRFDWNEQGDAEIDVNVDRSHRGSGLGPVLIRRAVNELLETTSVQRILAYIKQDNRTSVRAFGKAGFRSEGPVTVRGHQSVQYSVCRNSEAGVWLS